MKYSFIALVLLLIAGCSPKTTVDIVQQVKPGVVFISNQIDASTGGTGTGFIVQDNVIVTNTHVIDGPGKISVYSSSSQKKYAAQVVHKDVIADIAIIRLVDWELFKKEEHPSILTLADSNDAIEGTKVVVIGHPWGLTWTVSEGIISAKNRRAGQNPKYLDQVDAKIFQGNSGGPVFNEDGEVVCVSNMMLTGEGGSYGFCVPSNLVKKMLYDFNTFGEARWRTLNVSIGLTEDGNGVIIQNIEPGGAAGSAGLKEGDRLISVRTSNSKTEKTIVKPDDIITELATLRGDDDVIKLVVDRKGETLSVIVKTNFKLSKDYTPDKTR